ncbi:putative RNA-directed DNA polymerase from transposon BS [Trichonephila clavipes]|nr:putative RNA-directed DNA polymerase from transposon BS [Trichonephila clavipes]
MGKPARVLNPLILHPWRRVLCSFPLGERERRLTKTSKSTVRLFTTNRPLYNYSPEIFLRSECLNYSKYPTYLGFTLDSQVNCGKHIEKIADKARKRLKILKYLSGRDWGSDASTLRITYTTLVCPVLKYGYQIFQVASPTNLKKLEKVQLSDARIITGLRYSCPTDIVLYEADIQPLTMRFEVNSYRYFNKIKSFGSFNRTYSFIINWTIGIIDQYSKHIISHPELLRQLALEIINDIPDQALIVYTDGSCSDTGRAGSGIFSNTPGNDVKISIRNSDHCSVFRSELIAIRGALDHALNSYNDSIWILTDSRSSIQYLKNWPKIIDSTGLDILSKLVRLDHRKQVCLQWIPSHVGVGGNEDADELAGRGCDLPNPSSTVLTYT